MKNSIVIAVAVFSLVSGNATGDTRVRDLARSGVAAQAGQGHWRGDHAGWDGNQGGWHGHYGGRFGHAWHDRAWDWHGSHGFALGTADGAPSWSWGPAYHPYPYAWSFYDPAFEPAGSTYVERDPGYRYYCFDPVGYFPQVESCRREWLTVISDGTRSKRPSPQEAPPSRRP